VLTHSIYKALPSNSNTSTEQKETTCLANLQADVYTVRQDFTMAAIHYEVIIMRLSHGTQ